MGHLLSTYIHDPLRSEIITRILNPRTKCPEHRKCSGFGLITPICEFGPKDQKIFAQKVNSLFELCNRRSWFPLRDAIRKLNGSGALKTCEVQAAFFAMTAKITKEESERQAASYDSAREYGSQRIGEALKAVALLEKKIEDPERRPPDVSQTKRFLDYKRALCNLVTCGLKALEALYQIEERASSLKVLKVIHKAAFRLGVKELLHPSSTQSGNRYWAEIPNLLDGVEEIVRRPKSVDWNREPPQRKEIVAGTSLRQDINKISPSDMDALKSWFSMIRPDLYARMENEEDQIALLKEVMECEPTFPPMLSFLVPIALQYSDDFMGLRQQGKGHSRSSPQQ